MKKLISAMLAILMLASALCTLAPFVSAEEIDSTGETVYAYQSALTLDGFAGDREPGLMVQNYLDNNVRFGAAWDYENVYLVFQGISGEHIKEVHITLGTASVSVTENPAKGKKGDANVASTCGAEAASTYDCVEVAIPLSEVMLSLESGELIAALGFLVDTAKGADLVEADLVLSNRVLFYRNALYDGSGSFGIDGLPSRFAKADTSSLNNPTESALGIIRNPDYSYTFTDAAVGTKRVRLQAVAHKLYKSVVPDMGGAHHIDFELAVESLPEYDGSIEIADSIGDFSNPLPYIMFTVGARKAVADDAESTKLYIHNKKGTGLVLSIGFSDGSIEEVALSEFDIDFGTEFKFGVNVNNDSTLDLFINDDLVKTYTKRACGKGGGSSSQGYLIVCAQRDYTYGENDMTKFTLGNIAFSTLTNINTDEVLSLSKNGGEFPVVIEKLTSGAVSVDGIADPYYGAPISLGSLTKVRSCYDTSSGGIAMLFNIMSVGKIELDIGGMTAVIDINSIEFPYSSGKTAPALDATVSGDGVARVSTNKSTVSTSVELVIPASQLKGVETEDGLTKYDFDIRLSTPQSYAGSNAGVATNKSRGTLLVDLDKELKEIEVTESIMNLSVGSDSASLGLKVTNGVVTFEDTKISKENFRAAATTSTVKYLMGRQETKISADMYIEALPVIALNAIKPEVSGGGWLSMSSVPPRILFTANRLNEEMTSSECSCYSIYNTAEKGLVLAVTQHIEGELDKKTVEIIELGKQVGDTFKLDVVWGVDGSGKILVDNILKGSTKNATSALGANKTPALMTRNCGVFTVNFVRNRDLTEDEAFKATVSAISVGNNVISNASSVPITLKYVQHSDPASGKFDTRFISVLDSIAYSKVGYEIRIEGKSEVKDVSASQVYTSFINGGQKITAPKGDYFVILSESDLPVSDDTYTLIVRPYAVGMDGKVYYGTTFAIDYVDGKMVENEVYTYVYHLTYDVDPFVGSTLRSAAATTAVTLDEDKNSVVYDFGLVQSVNRAVLTSTNKEFAHFNKNSFGLYYSEDNVTYNYVREYSVLTVGNKVYFYNFDVNARYIKINSTANKAFSGEGKITNNINSILDCYYSDKPLLAEDEFLMTARVGIKNEKDVVANNTVFEFTLDDLGIDADDVKEDMSDIRFKLGNTFLPHYYSDGIFYVRVITLEANEEAEITVLYNNETAESVSHGDEVFEVQYGTKFGWASGERKGWFNSVVTLKNGDLMEMVGTGKNLYYYRSENGGMTWSPMTLVEPSADLDIGECGGFILDEVTGDVFYFAYYLEKKTNDSICTYLIFKSEDNGYTWEFVGSPVGADGKPAPQYALSYSNGLRWSKADGDGPGVDYVFTTGECRDLTTSAFCTTAIYSKDNGRTWIFSDSKINYEFGNTSYHEGGLSEETLYEKQDGSGTLMFYARCQVDGVMHFAKSYSYDGGITWTELTEDSFSNIYTVNTQPIIELTEDGTPVFLWGGNNSMGGRSYKRFPLNLAISYDDGETFVDITDASHQTVVAQLTRLHTNPDMTFYMYGGIENCWMVTTNYKIYILNSEDFLYKTKGAFDTFEDSAINIEGWQFAAGAAYLSNVGATDGKQALRFSESTIGTRSIHYLEEGKISFDLSIQKLGKGVDFELQTAYNDSRGVTAPMRFGIDGTGELFYYDASGGDAKLCKTGLKVKEGTNTITVEFNGNDESAAVTVNGEIADIHYISGIDNAISFFNVYTRLGSDVSIDKLMVIRTDK